MEKSRRVAKKGKINVLFSIVISIFLIFLIFEFVYFNIKSNEMNTFAEKYFKKSDVKKEFGKNRVDSKFNLTNSYYINYPSTNNKQLDNEINNFKNKIKNGLKKKFGINSIKNVFNNKFDYQLVNYELYLAPERTFGLVFIVTNINHKEIISEKVYTKNFSIDLKQPLKDSYIFTGNYKEVMTNYIYNYLNKKEKLKNNLKENYKDVINKNTDYKYIITNNGIDVYFNSNEILKSNRIVKINIPYSEMNNVMIDTSKITERYSKPIKIKKEKYNKNNKEMYIKKLTNFYESDGKNSKLISTISKGNKVNILEFNNQWSKIEYKDSTGYILNTYLSDEVVADSDYTDVRETVYANETVSIKSSSNDNSDTLGTLNFSDSITRIGTNDEGWSEVIYNNQAAYIKTVNLSIIKPSDYNRGYIDKNRNINPNKPMVALTFDDGPNPSSTGRILDTLSDNNAVATFFDLGKLVDTYPEIVKREENVGCEVASHTYSHYNLNNLSASAIKDEMNKSSNAFKRVLGHDVSLLRPPYGSANTLVQSNVRYPLILWNVDTLDWKSRDKEAIIKEIRKISNYDGKIILMHSIYSETADAVEVIVPELINKGYQLVTISEMAYYKGIELKPGEKYYKF